MSNSIGDRASYLDLWQGDLEGYHSDFESDGDVSVYDSDLGVLSDSDESDAGLGAEGSNSPVELDLDSDFDMESGSNGYDADLDRADPVLGLETDSDSDSSFTDSDNSRELRVDRAANARLSFIGGITQRAASPRVDKDAIFSDLQSDSSLSSASYIVDSSLENPTIQALSVVIAEVSCSNDENPDLDNQYDPDIRDSLFDVIISTDESADESNPGTRSALSRRDDLILRRL